MFKLWKNVLWINFSEPQIYGYRPFHSKHLPPSPLLNTPPLIKAQIWNWDSGMLNTPPCLRQIWECEKKWDFFFRLDKHPPAPNLFSESQNRQGGSGVWYERDGNYFTDDFRWYETYDECISLNNTSTHRTTTWKKQLVLKYCNPPVSCLTGTSHFYLLKLAW